MELEKLKEYYGRWEHLASPLFFAVGFIFDIFTLGRIDEISNVLIFSFYLTLSFIVLAVDLGFIFTKEYSPKSAISYFKNYKDEVFHFSQGALLSAFTLFYFKSASLSTSLVFLGLMVLLLLINELPFVQKLGLAIKGVFLNLTFLSFFLVYIPLMVGKIGLLIFIMSLGAYLILSLGLGLLFIKKGISRELIKKSWFTPGISLFIIFLFLRLMHWMPPVPLSLEKAGVYHNIEKQYPEYHLYHQKPWWRFWHNSDEWFRARPEDKVYFFTRIFAPRGFNDKVFVHWQKYTEDGWATSDRIPLTITGGREDGFRGYTHKSNFTEGEWRVMVETGGKLEIGRLAFDIELEQQDGEERIFKKEIDK